jgi:hypothetical protein
VPLTTHLLCKETRFMCPVNYGKRGSISHKRCNVSSIFVGQAGETAHDRYFCTF